MKKILMYYICLCTVMCLCACQESMMESGNAKEKTQEHESNVGAETEEQLEKRYAKEIFDIDLEEYEEYEIVNTLSEKEFNGAFQMRLFATKKQYGEIEKKTDYIAYSNARVLIDGSTKPSECLEKPWKTFSYDIDNEDEYLENKVLYDYMETCGEYTRVLNGKTKEVGNADGVKPITWFIREALVIDNCDGTYEIWLKYWE